MRRLPLWAVQWVRRERAIAEGPAQATAQWAAVRAGVWMTPPPQVPASGALPVVPMQVGRAIPVRMLPPRAIRPYVIPARMMT